MTGCAIPFFVLVGLAISAPCAYASLKPGDVVGPSIVMADVQLQHVTKAALPSLAYPGEEGWFFNRGAAVGDTEDFFTVAHMIESAH